MNKNVETKSVAFFERNSWYHRTKKVNPDGTIKYGKKGGFSTQEEAEESFKIYENDFQNQMRAYQYEKKHNTEFMFKDYLIYWFEKIFCERIRNTTKQLNAHVLYDIIIPSIEYDVKLKYVTVEYLDDLFKRCSVVCASAGNKSRELVNIALREAEMEGLIKVNPVMETKSYKRRKPKVRVLNKNELKKFLQVASKDNWYLEILLALFCGLRKGEILGLKFNDFDLDNQTVYIQRQVAINPIIHEGGKVEGYTYEERVPKTENSFRTLRVPNIVIEQLKIRKNLVDIQKSKLDCEYEDNGYVSSQKNGKPHSISAMNAAIKKLCSRNGIPLISVHGLRHMFATILIEQGVSLAKISGVLGHSSVNTTFEYYCDVMDGNDQIINYMNEVFAVEKFRKEA